MKLPAMAIVTVLSSFIPAIAGIARFKHLNRAMKVFLAFCIYCCCLEILEEILRRNAVNNTSLSNYYVPVESIFICVVYTLSVASKRIKRIISGLTLLFLCIWVADKVYLDIPGQMNSEMAVTSRVLIILISVMTIHAIVKQMNHPFIDEPIFWVSSGTLLYSTGVAPILGLVHELLKMGVSYYAAAWYINWSLEIISNLMYTKGFFCTAKSQISSG